MNRIRKGFWKTRERGVVTVEFAALFPFFIAFLVGIVEFGHIWYIQHALTNASREGARYGVVYRVYGTGQRIDPRNLTNPTIEERVKNYLDTSFVTKYGVTVDPPVTKNPDTHAVTNPGSTGDDLEVVVRANRNITILLGPLMRKTILGTPGDPGLPDITTLVAVTTMRLE